VNWRAAFAWKRVGGGEGRAELAGDEGVESAKARGKFGGGQAAFAVERAKKILGGALAFLGVAFETARDEVAVRIAPQLHAGHDVVEAVNAGGEATEAVKAVTTLACMDCQAQCLCFQEVRFLEVDGARDASGMASRANLLGQPNFDHVTGLAALDQAQNVLLDKPPHRVTHGAAAQAKMSRQPQNRKPQLRLPFQVAVPKKVGINGAVYDGQAQTWHQKVFQVFPDLFGVGFLGFHVQIQERKLTIESRKFRSEEKKQRLNTEDTEAGARRSKEKTPARCRRYKGGGSGCCRNLQYRAGKRKSPG
jgi:hypothetical protein